MHPKKESLILERKSLRLALGCCLVILPLGYLTLVLLEPDAWLGMSVLFGLLLMGVVVTLLHDASPKRNLIITPAGLFFSEGIYFYDQVEVKWDEINAVKFKALRYRTDHTTNRTEVIEISKIGETKPYRIKYSHLGGRQVQGHVSFFTAKRAIELIENLRNLDSEEERLEVIKASKGMSMPRYKHSRALIPFQDRLVLTCGSCESMLVYDKRKPNSERRCPSCGSEELSKG